MLILLNQLGNLSQEPAIHVSEKKQPHWPRNGICGREFAKQFEEPIQFFTIVFGRNPDGQQLAVGKRGKCLSVELADIGEVWSGVVQSRLLRGAAFMRRTLKSRDERSIAIVQHDMHSICLSIQKRRRQRPDSDLRLSGGKVQFRPIFPPQFNKLEQLLGGRLPVDMQRTLEILDSLSKMGKMRRYDIWIALPVDYDRPIALQRK